MKFFKTVVCLFLLSTAFTFIGCSGDDNGDGEVEENQVVEFLTAKINENSSFTATSFYVNVSTDDEIRIGGRRNADEDYPYGITLKIENYEGVGVYESGWDIPNGNIYSYDSTRPPAGYSSNNEGGSGTLMVTTDDGTTIEGTFSFIGVCEHCGPATWSFTEGKFKVAWE